MIHEDFDCEFYFIRHGESGSNATPGYAAGVDFDSPLTPKGYEQAAALGRRLNREGVVFDRVYCSTLQRAIQTTETMLEAMDAADRPFTKVEALIEQQSGAWRGKRTEDVLTPGVLAYMRGKGSNFVSPGGESLRMVQRRMSNWLEDEVIYNEDLVAKESSLRLAIVGHGMASRCLFQYIMGFNEALITRLVLDNCSISRFRFNKEGWSPLCINDSAHITEAALGGASAITP